MLNRRVNMRFSQTLMERLMRDHVAQELWKLGIHYTPEGIDLRNANYQELKWTLAFEMAKREV